MTAFKPWVSRAAQIWNGRNPPGEAIRGPSRSSTALVPEPTAQTGAKALSEAQSMVVGSPPVRDLPRRPDGRANARVVKAFPNGDGEDLWTRWFLTLRAGRKSAEIRAAGRVTLRISSIQAMPM
jgi:hypothetical protein